MPRTKGTVVIDVNDIVGKELENLVVNRYVGCRYTNTSCSGVRMRHYYECECSCGTIKIVRRSSLKNNKVRSCGCMRRKT